MLLIKEKGEKAAFKKYVSLTSFVQEIALCFKGSAVELRRSEWGISGGCDTRLITETL